MLLVFWRQKLSFTDFFPNLNNKKKASNRLIKFNHMTGHWVLCKAKAYKYRITPNSRTGRALWSGRHALWGGWHLWKVETSSHSERLCGLFLVPLGIPADLHLCQLDVADDISVWKTEAGKISLPARTGNDARKSPTLAEKRWRSDGDKATDDTGTTQLV